MDDKNITTIPFLTLNAENRRIILRQTAEVWTTRCSNLGLKRGTKGRKRELEAYLQGALAVLTATRVINLDHAAMVAVYVSAGRGESVIEQWALQ